MVHKLKLALWCYKKGGGVVNSLCHLLPMNRFGDFLWAYLIHRVRFGKFPHLKGPGRFSEHLLRIKLSDDGKNPLRVQVSDKELVKDYVRDKLGEGFTPNTLAILHSKEDLRSYSFPKICIIKPTHAAGKFILHSSDSNEINYSEIDSWFDTNYYYAAREPNYRSLVPKVIIEELIVEPGRQVPRDYKFFCFHGVPAFIAIQQDRMEGLKINYYSTNWVELNFCRCEYERSSSYVDRPKKLEQMLEIARILSKDFSFIRVDLYQIGEKTLVGELTNFPDACTSRFTPESADYAAGRLFDEPNLDVETLFGVR